MPKKNKGLFLAIQSVMIATLVSLLGLVNWLELSIDFTALTTSKYWAEVALKAVILVLAANIGTNFSLERKLASNENLRKYYEEYRALLKLKDNLLFDDFIYNVHNRSIKKRMFTEKTRFWLYWQDIFAFTWDKDLWNDKSTDPKIARKKQRNWYCKSKRRLLERMTPEWQEAHIDHTLVLGYWPTNPAAFSLSYGRNSMDDTKVNSREGVARFNFLLSGIITMTVISMFLASLFISLDPAEAFATLQSTLQVIITFISDTFFVLYQFYRGIQFADTIIEDEYVAVLFNRNNILKSYLAWAKNKPESSIKKILELIDKQIEEANKPKEQPKPEEKKA
jgi:hypothetical protein